MKKVLFVFCIAMASVLPAACSPPGPGASLYISWTAAGQSYSFTVGLDEAGGVPHGEVYDDHGMDFTALYGSTGPCSIGHPPARWAIMQINSGWPGTGIPGGLSFREAAAPPNGYDADLTIDYVTKEGDGGVLAGTFTGTITSGAHPGEAVTGGTFRVERNDTVYFFAP